MSRFPAELTITLTDGRTLTECFNQAEMAYFMRENMMECVHRGETLVVFDGDRTEIAPAQVKSVHVLIQDAVEA